jgi:hypothetical protein
MRATDLEDVLVSRRTFLAIGGGALTGSIFGIGLDVHWHRMGTGTSVCVLGAGKRVSVLITHEQRRILFASGSAGSLFSNAIGAALPAVGGEIDLLLLDPEASADVEDRARNLPHRELLLLPGLDDRVDQTTIRRSFVVSMGEDVSVRVDLDGGSPWAATVQSGTDRIDIIPSGSERKTVAGVVVCLDGSVGLDAGWAARVGPPVPGSGDAYVAVGAGEIRMIRIESDRTVIAGS